MRPCRASAVASPPSLSTKPPAPIGEFSVSGIAIADASNCFTVITPDCAAGSPITIAPAVMVARAGEDAAARQLEDANLQLSYTEIRSEIAGYIQDRSVNPGDRVSPGQSLLTVRPTYVWVAANYK